MAHVPRTEPRSFVDRTYVDLQPGWRIRVVTPILKSGKYKADFKETSSSSGSVELSAGDDFVGYETSYYAVNPRKDSGIAIVFASAEVKKNGKTSPQPQPLVRLFDLPENAHYVRLVFLTRVSRADHNQAILAAASLDDLNRLTQQLEADPAANCATQPESRCVWVPEGISVQPEKRNPEHSKNWVPAT